jgi:hypothetical protein
MSLRKIFFPILFFLGFPRYIWACNVPVFRYALEKWPADAYALVLYHQNGQIPADVESLLQEELIEKKIANLIVKKIDVNKEEGKRPQALPWIELYYPSLGHIQEAIWSGPCTRSNVFDLINSKARTRLADKLLQGNAVVWVVLKWGDQDLDAQATTAIKTVLKRAQQELKIPDTGTDINGNPIPVTDYKELSVSFDFIEVERSDPAENVFVQMLLHSESDLLTFNQPLVFPILGRGRLLYALVGEGVNEKNIMDACKSAISWCSCEIKALNPGIDLLLSADWSHPENGTLVKDQQVSPMVGIADFVLDDKSAKDKSGRQVKSDTGKNIDSPPIHTPARDSTPMAPIKKQITPVNTLYRNLLILACAIGVFLLAGSIVLHVRKRGHKP